MASAYGPLLALILSIATGAALAIEGLSWLLVYRTTGYRRLSDELERCAKKLELLKGGGSPGSTKGGGGGGGGGGLYASPSGGGGGGARRNKKEARLEENLKTASRELMSTKFKTSMIAAAFILVLYNILNTLFEGIVVAKLPFSPPFFMRRLTHQSLAGDDTTDCAAAFLFVLCSVPLRSVLQKLLGSGPSRAANRSNTFDQYMNKFTQQQ